MKTIFGSRAGFKGRRGRRWSGMRGLVSGDTTLKRKPYCWNLDIEYGFVLFENPFAAIYTPCNSL